jgi:hypothetical protein
MKRPKAGCLFDLGDTHNELSIRIPDCNSSTSLNGRYQASPELLRTRESLGLLYTLGLQHVSELMLPSQLQSDSNREANERH